jgi:hypothetical protein
MIEQTKLGLDSRSEANPRDEDNMFPLFTAPMTTVVDAATAQTYKDIGIHPIIPRTSTLPDTYDGWFAVSLEEFEKLYTNHIDDEYIEYTKEMRNQVLIDVANGNMPRLHTAIRKAKEIYDDSITIMAGNVSSVMAFEELAATGVDYIRVGIGGGGACMTTVHTGVGQINLEYLIYGCNKSRNRFQKENSLRNHKSFKRRKYTEQEKDNISKVKIVADGISSYIKKEGLHRNGYAAINQLLYAGANYVMIGSIFAASLDSPAEKKIVDEWQNGVQLEQTEARSLFDLLNTNYTINSLYRGMSTREEQQNYNQRQPDFKPSEGKSLWLDVEYTLDEWLFGCNDSRHDEFPGFVNALKSAMAYTGTKTLKDVSSL